jgi:hypothetical protein
MAPHGNLTEFAHPTRTRRHGWHATPEAHLRTSPHWLRREGLRLLALTSYRAATEPERAPELAMEYEDWMLRLGRPMAAAA